MVEQTFVRTTVRNSVRTFRRNNNGSTLPNYPSRSTDSFDSLIQVLVERIPAIGRYHHIKCSFDRLHCRFPHKSASLTMRIDQVPRKYSRNFTPIIECDVDQKAGPRKQSDVTHFFPNRVTFQNAECSFRIGKI